MISKFCLLAVTIATFFSLCVTMPSFAAVRWVSGTDSAEILSIIADPFRDRLYYGDGATNQIIVLDTNTESIIKTIQITGKPVMMDISKDGKKLAVAHSTLSIIDLDSYSVTPLSSGKVITDVAFDYAGNIYATSADYWGKVDKLDTATGSVLFSFGMGATLSTSLYQSAMLNTDATGKFLYVGERGLSPASLYKFDISGTTPVFMAEDAHGAIGSNLQDFAINRNGDMAYLASGSPYEIQEITTATIAKVNSLVIGPYPNAVALDVTGKYLYATASTQNYLYKFDLTTKVQASKEQLLTNSTSDEVRTRGLVVDRTGNKVFMVHGTTYTPSHFKIQVSATAPQLDRDGDGIADSNDNCPDIANTNQNNSDNDGMGDVCDPFPNDRDNLAACMGANTQLQSSLFTLTQENTTLMATNQNLLAENTLFSSANQQLTTENSSLSAANQRLTSEITLFHQQLADNDGDRIANIADLCANTPVGQAIDGSGCSKSQFCAAITAMEVCKAADWNNTGSKWASDCYWKNGTCNAR